MSVMGGTVILELDEVPLNGTLTSSLLIAFEEYSDRSVISETQEMRDNTTTIVDPGMNCVASKDGNICR